MGRLSYSRKALDTLSKFHKSKFVVYIEGEDDEPFWSTIFEINHVVDVYFKVAGGKEEIAKYEDAVSENDIDIVVARDSDYTYVSNSQKNHPRILYTYGYSIENTMYCPHNIAKAIHIFSRSSKMQVAEVSLWLESFVSDFKELLKYDFANEFFNKGIEVLGRNCTRFLKSNRSHKPNLTSVTGKFKELKEHFTESELKRAEDLIIASNRDVKYLIRGHFLSNAVINYIKNHSNLKSMSQEMLYGQMIALLPNNQSNVDVLYLSQQIKRLAA